MHWLPQLLSSVAERGLSKQLAYWIPAVLLFLQSFPAIAQPLQEKLAVDDAIRLAVERSPTVIAANARLDAAAAGLRGARAPFNPQAELAPGVGFTNGNAVLSQKIDISGQRSAQVDVASGLQKAAAAELRLAQLQTAAKARSAYYELARAQAVEQAAREAADLVRQIRDSVRRRVEIGEAPLVQETRADVELFRAEQEVARTAGERRARAAALNALLGRPADAVVTLVDVPATPDPPVPSAELITLAERARPELSIARGLLAARRGAVDVARAGVRPELFAEVAADTWSLDRDPFNTRNLGIQARLSFPLFDRGRNRAEVDRVRAGVREQEAEMEAMRRSIIAQVERASVELMAAREVALSYQQEILPRTEEILRSARAGFDAGLVTFLEVLEAQRMVRQTRTEYQNALFDAIRARIALDRAVGFVPGLTSFEPSEK